MKCLATFMAFLLLALSAVPCADAAHADDHDNATIAAPCDLLAGKDIHANDDGDHVETCSPFCMCTCCHSLMVAKDNLAISKYPIGSSELPIIYRASPSRLHSIEIFQPPKF